MKKIILIVAIIATSLIQNVFAQETTTQAVQIIIADYLNLKNSLIKDNPDSAQKAASTLSADLKNAPGDKLTSEQHKAWMKHYDLLISDATFIGSTIDLNNQREKFKGMSANLYKMLKALKINTVDLYYQYCSMADAYWISEKSNIANPYFGKKMLSCGSTKETLKANK